MAKRDFYEVLGVARDADGAALKSAFRKLAMQLHPDRNPGDATAELRFKEINEAYEILKDPQKRAAYDRFGHQAFEGNSGGAGAAGFSSFADIFDEFFGDFRGAAGGGARRSGRERGSDLRYNLEITLEEAFVGKTVEVEVPTSVTCDVCSGSGAKPGSSPKTCTTCNGAGRVRASQGGLLPHRAHLSDVPRPWRGGAGPLHQMRRGGPREPVAHPFGEHPRRDRGRHPHPTCRRGRGGRARRSRRRPLHLPVHQAARVLPARWC
jgi:DnaJ-class molecular chaperone